MNKIGVMYYEGKGVEQDYQKAMYWYKNHRRKETSLL